VQLEASQPEQAHRQAFACAYHVADVIEALRRWAGERDLAGGQLTILAIEPDPRTAIEALRRWAGERDLAGGQLTILAIEPDPRTAGGRQATGTGNPDTAGLSHFAFTTLPLRTIPPGSAPTS
jgi:peptidyl-tRNA hydrolase